MSEPQPETTQTPKQRSRWGIIAAAVIAAFLIGFVPMWLTARNNAAERDAVRSQLRRSEISNLLSSAIVDARRGEYEAARQETSNFFTRVTAEEDRGDESFMTAEQRAGIKPLLANRDTLITLLAQRDPASTDRLTDLYVAYAQAVPPAAPAAAPAR